MRSYFARFTEECLQIQDPNDQVTIAFFIHGLLPGWLTQQLQEDYPTSLAELWERVDRSIQGEEANKVKRNSSTARPNKKDKGNQGRGNNNDASSRLGRDCRSVFDKISKEKMSISNHELTPLNASRSQVLAVMKQTS